MRTIAIINQKGGCGKTTTAINLAGVLAAAGKRTLLVDLDPQSHCAAGLAIPEQRIDVQIGDAMLLAPDAPIDWTRLLWRISRHLDLAPSTVRLAGIEAPRGPLAGAEDAEKRLDRVLTRLADQYDLCLIDCSPAIGMLTFNALVAASEILIPVETAFFALQGASKQVSTFKALAKRLGSSPSYRLLPTMHDPGSTLSRDVLDEIHRRFEGKVAPTVIRLDQRLREAASFGQPVVEYAPESHGAEDYLALGRWILDNAEPGVSRLPAAKPEVDERVSRIQGAGINLVEPTYTPPLGAGVIPVSMTTAHRPPVTVTSEAGTKVLGPSTRPSTHTAKPKRKSTSTAAAAAIAQATEPLMPATARLSMDEAAARITELATTLAAQERPVSTLPAIDSPDAALRAAEDARRQLDAFTAQTAELAQRVGLLAQITGRSEAQIEPKPARTSSAIFGVFPTSMGVLFVQPADLGHMVYVAGDFNGWNPESHRMKLNEELGVLECTIPLPAGDHQYRLVADGQWTTDPHNPYSVPNSFSTLNSVAVVP